ncbi:MAG: DNA-processing protein DprA [Lachnospiraceae bacterium]|nr:DNA-processing protein DprA [Lachnospiraceae bacterium]
MRNDDILYDFWWACIGGGYSMPLCRLAMEAGSARHIYEMKEKSLFKLKGVTERCAAMIKKHREEFDIETEYEKSLKKGIRFIPYHSSSFPERLRRISGHPFAIFVKGEVPLDDRPSVALIGARNCSEYGRKVASMLGESLAERGIPVVSGMAYGIDGTAQMACLKAGGLSYGVLGSGVDVCYPEANRKIYDRLCLQGGVISEYGPQTMPRACLFPARNRLIAGLSDLVVVVEARARSGTGITVDMALDQGKDVAVIPGRITDPLSEGCIRLWKQGAIPVSSVEDIIDLLEEKYGKLSEKGETEETSDTIKRGDEKGEGVRKSGKTNGGKYVPSENEARVLETLDYYAKSTESLCEESGLDILEFMRAVMMLMAGGFAKELGKGYYVKI